MSPISSRKSVPPSAASKRPGARVDGPGERALLVAEELALEERLRQGGAGHLDEGPVPSRAVLVERLGEQLLAGAALAEEQHRGGGGGHLADRLEDRQHLRALAHQVVEAVLVLEPLAQRARLLHEALPLQGLLEDDLQLLDVDRLAEVVLGAELHRLDRRLDRAVGGHDDDHRLRAHLLDLREQLDPVHARHAQVGEDDVGVVLLERAAARRARRAPGRRRSRPPSSRVSSAAAAFTSSSMTTIRPLTLMLRLPRPRPAARRAGSP